MPENAFHEQIVAILNRYDELPEGQEVKSFLVKEMLASGHYADNTDAETSASKIVETIDAVDKAYRSLQDAKAQGSSREKWIHDQLADSVSKVPAEERESMIQGLATEFGKANGEVSSTLFGENVLEPALPVSNYEFADLNARTIAKRIHQEIQDATLLGAISVDEGFNLHINPDHQEVKAAKKFLDSALDSPTDAGFKKVVSGAVDITKRSGKIPTLQGKSPEEVSLIVEQGVTVAKLGYKVANGEFQPTDVTDYLIDKTAARVSTILKLVVSKTGMSYGTLIGASIGSVFSPAGAFVGAGVGAVIGAIAGEKVGKVLATGIKKVAHIAKEVCKAGWRKAKEVLDNIREKFWSIFS